MKKMIMWDKYDNCYRQVIDVNDLKEHLKEKIKGLKDKLHSGKFISQDYIEIRIETLQSFLEDLENCEV